MCDVSPVGAARVHEVGEELDVARPELLLALHVHVGEVTLADLRSVTCYVSRVTCVYMIFITIFYPPYNYNYNIYTI